MTYPFQMSGIAFSLVLKMRHNACSLFWERQSSEETAVWLFLRRCSALTLLNSLERITMKTDGIKEIKSQLRINTLERKALKQQSVEMKAKRMKLREEREELIAKARALGVQVGKKAAAA